MSSCFENGTFLKFQDYEGKMREMGDLRFIYYVLINSLPQSQSFLAITYEYSSLFIMILVNVFCRPSQFDSLYTIIYERPRMHTYLLPNSPTYRQKNAYTTNNNSNKIHKQVEVPYTYRHNNPSVYKTITAKPL